MKGLARGNTEVAPMDSGEPSSPSTSARDQATTLSNAEVSQNSDESPDTTSTPMRALPLFRFRRFFTWPAANDDSSLTSEHDNQSPSITTSDDDDYKTVHSQVPSLSSLETGQWDIVSRTNNLQPGIDSAVPLNMEEMARYLTTPNPLHPENNNVTTHPNNFWVQCETDSECGSNSSSSSESSLGYLARSLMEPYNILFPAVATRHGESCKSYMFSVFVGIVVFLTLGAFIMIVTLK